MNRAVFLDRDGVLIEDVDLLIRADRVKILPQVPRALNVMRDAGFELVVVSNQTVVARGLATEADVRAINARLQEMLLHQNSPSIHGWYFCPHHPNATLPSYRLACECRKPRPGLFMQAARELSIDLSKSFTVGDRLTDIVAGTKAGTRTVLVETGLHSAPPIQTVEPIDSLVRPDYICSDLLAAADWILRNK